MSAWRVSLAYPAAGTVPLLRCAQSGFFLKELFSKVIFADRQLVQQYTSRNKAAFALYVPGRRGVARRIVGRLDLVLHGQPATGGPTFEPI